MECWKNDSQSEKIQSEKCDVRVNFWYEANANNLVSEHNNLYLEYCEISVEWNKLLLIYIIISFHVQSSM